MLFAKQNNIRALLIQKLKIKTESTQKGKSNNKGKQTNNN